MVAMPGCYDDSEGRARTKHLTPPEDKKALLQTSLTNIPPIQLCLKS